MKTLILFLALAVTLNASPFHHKPVAKPVATVVAPAVEPAPGPLPEPEPAPFTVNPDGSVTLSKQHDAELKDWIIGIQTVNAQNAQRAADAETSEAKVRKSLGEANGRADVLEVEVVKVTDDRNAQAAAKDAALIARDEAIAEKEKEKTARVAAEAHVSKIKNYLSLALGLILVLVVSHIPTALFPYPPFGKPVAMVAAMGLGWVIVARFV